MTSCQIKCNFLPMNTSEGVRQSKTLRGRWFSWSTQAWIFSSLSSLRSVFRGKHSQISPLVFSIRASSLRCVRAWKIRFGVECLADLIIFRKLSASVRCDRQNPLSLAVPLNFRSLRPSHILSWLGVHVVRLRILNDVQPIWPVAFNNARDHKLSQWVLHQQSWSPTGCSDLLVSFLSCTDWIVFPPTISI